jgi:hypothetical protein
MVCKSAAVGERIFRRFKGIFPMPDERPGNEAARPERDQ